MARSGVLGTLRLSVGDRVCLDGELEALRPARSREAELVDLRLVVGKPLRDQHGGLLDAEILTDVYLAMTGGQAKLSLDRGNVGVIGSKESPRRFDGERPQLRVIAPTDSEVKAHQRCLAAIEQASGGKCLWNRYEADEGVTHATCDPSE